MVKTNSILQSPIVLTIGLLSLFACNNPKTPAELTTSFWSAMAENDIEHAKEFCSPQSKNILVTVNPLLNSTFTIGKIVIEGNQAKVETLVTSDLETSKPAFTTFLLNQENHWKIDCKRSINNFLSNPFNHFFNKLNDLGEAFNKHLEQQLPLIEEKIELFGRQLQDKIDSLGDEYRLQKPSEKEQNNPYQGTI